jgi:hypothetical protein
MDNQVNISCILFHLPSLVSQSSLLSDLKVDCSRSNFDVSDEYKDKVATANTEMVEMVYNGHTFFAIRTCRPILENEPVGYDQSEGLILEGERPDLIDTEGRLIPFDQYQLKQITVLINKDRLYSVVAVFTPDQWANIISNINKVEVSDVNLSEVISIKPSRLPSIVEKYHRSPFILFSGSDVSFRQDHQKEVGNEVMQKNNTSLGAI